jgi:NADPH:quinone reductase
MSIHKEDLRAVRVNAKAASADELSPTIEKQSPPALQKGEALVRVRSAGVNPSDVKAALGIMPQAVFPTWASRAMVHTRVGWCCLKPPCAKSRRT